MYKINWPLMENNINRKDLDRLISYLGKENPRLTQSSNVEQFEKKWSEWLGVKYSVFVNSGASSNFMTMAAIKHLYGAGEVIVPTLTWVSDISSVIINGHKPVFVDIDDHHLGMDEEQVRLKITEETKAIFITHVLGLNALSDSLIQLCKDRNILLIEDTCESHGAKHKNKRLGSIGFASNFSFYYAHHMSTIEGGMVCTNDIEFYETIRMLRSHGMVREVKTQEIKDRLVSDNPKCNPEFIFKYPTFNFRSTELNAVIGLSQLEDLDQNNKKRSENFKTFLESLNSDRFRTEFKTEGSVNYAFILIIKDKDEEYCSQLMSRMHDAGIEFRRGLSGGGNQLRQPYLKNYFNSNYHEEFPKVEHVHSYGFYLGNYPTLSKDRVLQLCTFLNEV
jgi:CDP-4-dehydro-6-deoxyglucose reductase, E1